MTSSWKPSGVHFTGSVSLPGPEAVFRELAKMGPRLKRLPDGETEAPRSWWVGAQVPLFMTHELFEPVPPQPGEYGSMGRMKLKTDVPSSSIRLGSPNYATAAIHSYAIFSQLKKEKVIPANVRFQFAMPSPLGVMVALIDPHSRGIVEPVYEPLLLAEVDKMLEVIPAEELSIQWDIPIEVGLIEDSAHTDVSWIGNNAADIARGTYARCARIGDHVPRKVELGYHLCYGGFMHKHFKEPSSLDVCVQMINAICAATQRPVDYFHMPASALSGTMPGPNVNEAFFAPLRNVAADPETTLYLGVVSEMDGLAGSQQRIEWAHRYLDKFGITTECGLGGDLARPSLDSILRTMNELAGPA